MVNHHSLAYGDHHVAQALETAKSRESKESPADNVKDFRHFLSVLIIGVGRACRGEIWKVLIWQLDKDSRLDKFDPRRRFEYVHPEIRNRVGTASAMQPEDAARALLDIVDGFLAPIWDEYPHREVEVVRRRLSWDS